MLSAVKLLTIPRGKAYPLASEFGIQNASSPFPSEVLAPLIEASVICTGVPVTVSEPDPATLVTSFVPFFIGI